MGDRTELAFIASVRRRDLLPRGSSIVAAVSGGADSMAMLMLLSRFSAHMSWEISVLHIDHRTRSDSWRDAEFARGIARDLRLPFTFRELQPVNTGRTEGEMSAARAAIYDEVSGEGSLVAVGHTSDDRAETLLIRLMEGSGLRGLGGMDYRGRGPVRRPILDLSRRELRDWLKGNGHTWLEDPTNRDPVHLRNRVRESVLPAIAAADRGGVAGMARAARNLSTWRDAMDWLLDRTISGILPDGECLLDDYIPLPEAVRVGVLWSLCRRPRGGRIELDKADIWLSSGKAGSHPLPGGYSLVSDGGCFRVIEGTPCGDEGEDGLTG